MDGKVESEKDGKRKALFFQRLVAFIIDMVLISFIAALISAPFTNSEKLEKLEKKEIQILKDYTNEKIDSETYIINYTDVYYDISRASGITSIVVIFLEVLYFVVYQLYKNGQTIGKKIMKIRVISKDGELSMNQMIFRSFISNFILMNIISFILMLFTKKSVYFYANTIIGSIQYIIVIISIFMVMSKKNGCAVHDKLVHTEVVREN